MPAIPEVNRQTLEKMTKITTDDPSVPRTTKMKKNTVRWAPQEGPQMAFHDCPIFELLYGGAAGGGKSESLIVEAVTLCLKYPKYRAILFRRTFPEIEKSLVPRVTEMIGGSAKSRAQGMEWSFHNGSVLYLSHLQREEDKEKHKSSEYDYIGFDELTSFTETQYIYLFSRCRGTTQVERFVRGGTNPTGIGHGWVKRRFIDPPKDQARHTGNIAYRYAFGWMSKGKVYKRFQDLPEGYQDGHAVFSDEKYKVFTDLKSGNERSYIPALLWANQKLLKADPEYAKRIRALDEKTQEALLYGSWDAFEGQFFAEWDPTVHVVDAFPIPPHWRRYVAIDYGYSAPFCAVFGATDEKGVLYIYREIYGSGFTTEEQAKAIKDSLLPASGSSAPERIEWFACDPSMFAKHGSGESHSDIYDRHGLSLIPSTNKRIPGWALMHELLSQGRLKLFRNCVNGIRTIPEMMHDKAHPEDLESKGTDDHEVDAIRYLIMTLRGGAAKPVDQPSDIPSYFLERKALHQKRKTLFGRFL